MAVDISELKYCYVAELRRSMGSISVYYHWWGCRLFRLLAL